MIGARGLIGSAVCTALAERGVTARQVGRDEVDLSGEAVGWKGDWAGGVVYLCAGVASIRACRVDPLGTWKVNVSGALALAERVREAGGFLVFLSSNQAVQGATEYGRQKAEVERALLREEGSGSVVRLTKVLGRGLGLFETWRRALEGGGSVRAFGDMVMSPVGVDEVARVLVRIGTERRGGMWQVSGERDVDYWSVARHLAGRWGFAASRVERGSFREAGIEEAEAPRNTVMDVSRLRRDLRVELRGVWETIAWAGA